MRSTTFAADALASIGIGKIHLTRFFTAVVGRRRSAHCNERAEWLEILF